VVLDPGFALRVDGEGVLRLRDEQGARSDLALDAADPVRLEVFGNRCMSIAEQMGAVLRNTSVSTNIKERLDYSCAVFDGDGGLVANAPHIPVHLGAMAETVAVVRSRFPELAPGDAVVTNDPFAGGSHLPDVTVVTPVFTGGRAPDFFVASRGHHADIGGTTPGSIPADSRTLEEEGVLIEPFLAVRAGRFDEARVRALLAGARYPARRPDDNVAELVAMIAANRGGRAAARGLGGGAGHRGNRARRCASCSAPPRESAARDRAPAGRRAPLRRPHGRRYAGRRAAHGRRRADGDRLRGHRRRGGRQPERAARGRAGRGDLRAAEPGRGAHSPERRLPRAGDDRDPARIAARPAARGGGGRRQRRDVAARRRRAARRDRPRRREPGHDEQRGVRRRDVRLLRDDRRRRGRWTGLRGASGVHTHMTNTRITDPEVLELRHPVRLVEFALRRGSGGNGASRWRRAGAPLPFLAPVTASLLTERRTVAPYGLAGGSPGARGRKRVLRAAAPSRSCRRARSSRSHRATSS
jgi:5-oxoprolinase (ATP-hydrolysing)